MKTNTDGLYRSIMRLKTHERCHIQYS